MVKQSSKGGACAIVDSDYYQEKIFTILNDKEAYKKVIRYIDNVILQKIESLANKYQEQLTIKEKTI